MEAGNRGRVVAIDVDIGAFEVADDTLSASRQLLARHPDAQIWCVRVGHPAVHRFGSRGAGMMSGTVNSDPEAVLRLSLRDAGGAPHGAGAVIDTGFNGFLTLTPSLIEALGLPWLCRQHSNLRRV